MPPSRFLVAGQWRDSGRKIPVRNPFNGQTEGEVYQAGPQDIDEAVEAAVRASKETRKLQSYERASALLGIAGRIKDTREEFARLITSDTGKPIQLARTEVERSAFTFTVAAEEAKRIGGELLPLDLARHSRSRIGLTRRFPLGAVSAITPFNFPINLVAHKLGPALAAGNSIVLKPASTGARVALLLGEICLDVGLPVGAVNIVTCSGDEASQLISDERLKLVSFTGSPAIGWGLKSKAGKKKVVLELGGNAAVVIDETTDPSKVVPNVVHGSFANAGQSCIAVQRILVHESRFDQFCGLFVEAAKAIQCGDPTDDNTLVGPMIDEQAAMRVEGWISEAIGQGARLLTGGKRNRAVLEPTVLTDVRPDMNVSCQELFAPVVTIDRFSNISEAFTQVNDSRFGLQAGLFTNNLSTALLAFEMLEVGGVIVNDVPTFRIDHMPYGGIKDSGFGREGVRYAIEEMTELKLLVVNEG